MISIDMVRRGIDPRLVRRLLLFFVGLTACQAGVETSQTQQEIVVVSPVSPHDFGSLEVGQQSGGFVISVNPAAGANDDLVTAVNYSCPDFVISAPGLPADVFRTCDTTTCFVMCPLACTTLDYQNYTFTTYFHPTVAGTVSCALDIVTNNATHHSYTLTGTGTVPPVQISASRSSIPFGDVRRNTNSTPVSVTIYNLGGQTMSVSSATVPGGYLIASGPTAPYNVGAGGAQTYTLECHPTAVGGLGGNFTINSNDPTRPMLNIPMSCNGIDSNIDISPSPAVLTTTRVGEPVSKTITITNSGAASSMLQHVSVTGMTMISGPPDNTPLAPSGSTQVMVSFDASTPGAISGTLNVTYDGGQLRTAQISADALATSMSLNPDGDVDFGPICIGQTKQQMFTILANDQGPFKIQALSAPSAPFTLTAPTLPASVQGAGANNVPFTITTAPTDEGVTTATVEVDTDIPNAAPRMINLSVTGLAAGVTPTPAELDLGSNPINMTTLGQPVRLSNCSTTPITASNARIEGPDAAEFAIVAQPDNLTIPASGNASWLVILNAHTVGVKEATFSVDYDGGTATIALTGEGLGEGVGGSGGGAVSYYACSTGRPAALWPIALAVAFLVRRRRR